MHRLGRQIDPHSRIATCALAQHHFNFRLNEGAVGGPAQQIGRWLRIKALDQLPLHAEVVGARMRTGDVRHGLAQAAPLKHPVHFMIEGDGAWLVEDLGGGFHHLHRQPFASEQIGGHRTHRPVADDDDIHLRTDRRVLHRLCLAPALLHIRPPRLMPALQRDTIRCGSDAP